MSSNGTPNKSQLLASPAKFVKPADLFKMRRRTSSNFGTPNNSNSRTSPIKGASSSTRSSPVKTAYISSSSNQSQLTPNKNISNLKPIQFSPRPFQIESQSPLKCLNNVTDPSPTKKLPGLLRNPFNQPVKRRLNLFSPRKDGSSGGASLHNRSAPNKRTRLLEIDEDANLEPPRMKHASLQADSTVTNKLSQQEQQQQQCYTNDWTLKTKIRINLKKTDNAISLNAIKENSTVYQHPYLAWLPLFPRMSSHGDNPYKLSKNSVPARMLQEDWCKSFKNLIDMLSNNQCPYFYLCSDTNNILFKQNQQDSTFTAHITPFYYNMGLELAKTGIKFDCPEMTRNSSFTRFDQENSQSTSFSSSSRATNSISFDENSSQVAIKNSKLTASGDSGNYSDLLDDEFGIDENDEDASTCLESLGLSTHDFKLISKPGGFQNISGSTRPKTTSTKPLAIIEGLENILKLAKLLQSNRTYTITNVGKFASIPPTLLAPVQFCSSTLQNLDVNMVKNESSTSIELEGVILPNLFKKLHALLPDEHFCTSDSHSSTKPFRDLTPHEH